MVEFLHKYCVTLNDNITLFQPHFDILFSKNTFETLKVDVLFTCAFYGHKITFDVDVLTSLTHLYACIYFENINLHAYMYIHIIYM